MQRPLGPVRLSARTHSSVQPLALLVRSLLVTGLPRPAAVYGLLTITGDLGCREYPLLAPYCPGGVPCLAGTFFAETPH
jgi:hypothetical protein